MSGLTTVALVVLTVAAWPVYRLLSIPQVHREYRCVFYRAIVLLVIYAACVAVIAILYPLLAITLACIALTVLAGERWRARPGYGTRRALPPGSLTLVPRGPWTDEKFFARQAQRYGPVFKMSQYFRPMICVMGPSEGLKLLRADSEKLFSPEVPFSARIPRGFIRFMTPANHRKYRPIFQIAMRPQIIHDCMPDVLEILGRGLAAIAVRSNGPPGLGLHPGPELESLTFEVMLRIFLGVHQDPRLLQRLRELQDHLVVGKAACRSSPKESESLKELAALLARRGDRMLESERLCVLSEIACRDRSAIEDPTVILNLVYMIRNGTADFSGFLTWAVKLLVDNPQYAWQLRESSAASEPTTGKLAEYFIRESLRLERSEYIYRRARDDIEYRGMLIPRGWIVRICIRDGHRDPRVFHDPDRFDPLRFAEADFSPAEYSPLGIGAHSCLGANIIRAVGAAFVVEWTRQYDVVVLRDGPREYGRSHWQPSSAMRIQLRAIG